MWRLTTLAALVLRLAQEQDPMLDSLKAALATKNTQEAHSWEQRLLAGDESADALLMAGALFAQYDKLADAAAIFERCAERFPASFEAKYNLTLARIGLNDYSAAEASLHSISPASKRETAAVEYLQGKIYVATGRQGEARRSLENAYKSNPDEENYALDLALLYIRSSAYVPAIAILRQSINRHPESENLTLELALSDALAGRATEALAICRKLFEHNPNLSAARVIAAFANCLSANYDACKSEAAAGLSLRDPNPYLHYLYAEALWNAGSTDRPKIMSELDAALAQMPSCGVCFLLRSRVFEAEQNNQAAITDLQTVLGMDKQSTQAWYRLSALYRKAGQETEAADAMRHYRAIDKQQINGEIESFRRQFVTSLNNQTNQ
jgi:tetratricopeptide (TPR) repeat protein